MSSLGSGCFPRGFKSKTIYPAHEPLPSGERPNPKNQKAATDFSGATFLWTSFQQPGMGHMTFVGDRLDGLSDLPVRKKKRKRLADRLDRLTGKSH